MNLKDYIEKTDFATGKGLPEGDTYIAIGQTEVEEAEFDGKKTFKLKLKDGSEYFVPRTVMDRLKKVSAEGYAYARVTRQGKGKEDTKYTTVGVKETPK